MPDIQRRATRIKMFHEKSLPTTQTITSDIWNITPGQAFSVWVEDMTSSASITLAMDMYPGLNGTGGDPVRQTLASSAAVGILSGSDIQINEDISKAVRMVATYNGPGSPAMITVSLLMY